MPKNLSDTHGELFLREKLTKLALMLFYLSPVTALLVMAYGEFIGNDYIINCAFFYILVFVLMRILYEIATENVNYIILDCPSFLKNIGKTRSSEN